MSNLKKGGSTPSNETDLNPIKEVIKTAFWLAVFTSGVVISLCSAFPIVKTQEVVPDRKERLLETIGFAEVIHEDVLLGRKDAIKSQLHKLLSLNHSAIAERAPTVWIEGDTMIVVMPLSDPQSIAQFEPLLMSIGFTLSETVLTSENQTGLLYFERTYATSIVNLLLSTDTKP
ncbi:hypothetical protein AB6D11_00975 [Vibrio splendidus]